QHSQFIGNLWRVREMVHCFANRRIERFVNILPAIPYFEHLGLETLPFALFANQFDIRQKLHFNHHSSVTLAGLATSAWNVEGEVPCGKATFVGFWSARKQIANSIESFDVSHRIRSRRAADRRLVNQYDFVNKFVPRDLIQERELHWVLRPSSAWVGVFIGLLLQSRERSIQDIVQ